MAKILNFWRGIDLPAWLVGMVRGAVEAAALAAVAVFIQALDAASFDDQWAGLVMIIIVGLRSIEGAIDQIDPAKKRT
jgi:hypothetical protein